MAYEWCEIEYWWENDRVINNDIESRKNLACFQTYRTAVQARATLFTAMFLKAGR